MIIATYKAVDFNEIEHRYYMREMTSTGESEQAILEDLARRGIQYDRASIRFETVNF